MIASYRACGKLILLGEHFVVHGTPALAAPIAAVSTEASVLDDPAAPGPRLDVPFDGETRDVAESLLRLAVDRLAIPANRGWQVRVRSDVPIGYGLGSSAAFAVAVCGALARAAGHELSLDALNAHAHALERVVHGAPSGVDDTVITWGRAVSFRRGEPFAFVTPGRPLRLVLASTPRIGTTHDAVAGVGRLRQSEPARFDVLLRDAGWVALQGLEAFRAGDAPRLGTLLDENHRLLLELGVSIPALDRLALAARQAGALGAKMTGGGLGGFVVALCREGGEADVTQAMRAAGGDHVMTTEIAP